VLRLLGAGPGAGEWKDASDLFLLKLRMVCGQKDMDHAKK
jgi:hypothetical protein